CQCDRKRSVATAASHSERHQVPALTGHVLAIVHVGVASIVARRSVGEAIASRHLPSAFSRKFLDTKARARRQPSGEAPHLCEAFDKVSRRTPRGPEPMLSSWNREA